LGPTLAAPSRVVADRSRQARIRYAPRALVTALRRIHAAMSAALFPLSTIAGSSRTPASSGGLDGSRQSREHRTRGEERAPHPCQRNHSAVIACVMR